MKEYAKALITLYASTVLIISDIYVGQPILPMLVKDFHISPTKASLAVSLTILFLAFMLLIYGPLSDYFGRKPVMIVTGFSLVIPTILISFSKSFDIFLLMRSLQGCFVAGIAAIAMAYISEEFPWSILGRAMGIYIAAMITAGLSGRILGGLFAGLFGWRIMFFIFAMLNLLGSIFMLLFLPSSRNFKKSLSIKKSFFDLLIHFKNRILIGAFLIAFFLFFTFTCTFTYVSFYLTKPPFGLSIVTLSFIYFVYIAGIVAPFSGAISNKIGRKPVIATGLFTAIFGISLTLLPNLFAVIIGLFFLCSGLFITQPAASAMISDNAKKAKGSATSLYLFFYYIGGSAGAFFPGFFWTFYGWIGIAVISIVALVFSILSLIILCR